MSAWTKTLLSFLLICYLAVSSIAAVHAFPVSSTKQQPSNNQVDMSDASDIFEQVIMPCHQITYNNATPELDSNNTSVSACEIFCAAMSNAISHDFAYVGQASKAYIEVLFIQLNFYTGDPSLEPHPPK